jgi:peptidoglycan/LPS O-acetylase OafA/YrhL
VPSLTRTDSHYAQLDGLRGLAALAVVLSHSISICNTLDFGPAGVRLFFVLSGFLITGILLRARAEAEERGVPVGSVLGAFYVRRSLRIFPVYYVVVLLATALSLPGLRETFWPNVTYTNNLYLAWRGEHVPGAVNHLWTLAVEEQFYLIWPFVVLWLPARYLVPVLLAMVAIGPASRAVLASFEPGDDVASKVLTCCCLDSLGLGALLAASGVGRPSSVAHLPQRTTGYASPTRLALWLGLALMALALTLSITQQAVVVRRTIKALAFSLVSLWLVAQAVRGFRGPVGALLASRPLVYLGSISYGLYLIHVFVPPLLALLAESVGLPFAFKDYSPAVRFAVMFGGTLPLAMLSWHFLEKPLNDLKRHFPYVRRTAPALDVSPSTGHSRGGVLSTP